jgi:hypothetical protein
MIQPLLFLLSLPLLFKPPALLGDAIVSFVAVAAAPED